MLQNINIITNCMFLIFLVNIMCVFFCTFGHLPCDLYAD